MTTGPRTSWTRVVWSLLILVDVLVLAGFGVTAAIEPYHVLDSEGVERHNFQGLLPTMIVVALRSMTLAAERRMLSVEHPGLVLIGRLASLIAFYYTAQWLYARAHGRWYEVVLGGTFGYGLIGVIAIGVIMLIYNLPQIRPSGRTPALPRRDTPINGNSTEIPDTPRPATDVPPHPTAAATRATKRRALTKDSLFGLVGVFTGVTGLAMGVTNLLRLGVAVLLGTVAVAGITVLLPSESAPHRGDTGPWK